MQPHDRVAAASAGGANAPDSTHKALARSADLRTALDVHHRGHPAAPYGCYLIFPVRLEHHPSVPARDDEVVAIGIVGVLPGPDA
jgi:hypothetical protein